jgi:hypothetical protein
MSYYARIYFKKVKSMEDGIKTLNAFIKEYSSIDNMKKVIEENRYDLYRYIYTAGVEIDITEPYKCINIFKHLLQPLLIFKAMYYPQYNLLGLCFYDSQNIIDKYFDGLIEFQNSCDQDYEYDTWNILGEYFINKTNEFKDMPLEKVLELNKHLSIEEDGMDYLLKTLDYHRRSTMYDFVWDTLDLYDWLYYKESKSNIFMPINLCVPLTNDNENLFYSMHAHFLKLFEEDNDKKGVK